MYNRFESKYDKYGRLKTEPWPDIKKGDKVHWLEVEHKRGKKHWIHHYGIWDGEKAELDGPGNPIVRTIRWLTKV